MKYRFLSSALVFIFGVLLCSCGKVEQPQFRRLESFGVKNVSLQEATIGFKITYFNPNNFGVAVKEAAIDLYVDTVYVGKFLQPQPIDVNGVAEFSIPMEGKLSLQKLLRSNLHKQAGKEVAVRAEGTVKVGKAGVFVNKDIQYAGRHTLDLDVIKNPAGAGFGF